MLNDFLCRSALIKILSRQDSINEGIRSLRNDFRSDQAERQNIVISTRINISAEIIRFEIGLIVMK